MLRRFLTSLLFIACSTDLPPSHDEGMPSGAVDASADEPEPDPPEPKDDGCTECHTCEAECVGCTLTGCERTTCCALVGNVCSCTTSSWSPAPSCVVGYCL